MARTPTPEQIQRRAAFAQEDLHAAERIVEAGAYSHAAFSCHQATEKYLKALWMQQRGEEPRKTHNVVWLAREPGAPQDVIYAAEELDPEYLSARYPDMATSVLSHEWDEQVALTRLARAIIAWAVTRLGS